MNYEQTTSEKDIYYTRELNQKICILLDLEKIYTEQAETLQNENKELQEKLDSMSHNSKELVQENLILHELKYFRTNSKELGVVTENLNTVILEKDKVTRELEQNKIILNELQKYEQLKEEFATMVTHELKTPLTPIRGYCEMLMDENFGTLTKDQLRFIKEIDSSAILLERLIGDVLDVQKLDINRMQFNKTNIDIDAFLDKLTQDSIPLMKDKGIEFFVTNSIKTSIKTDELRLYQIFENLIRNSADFVPSTNGKIEIGSQIIDGKIEFYVKDNGMGIPKDKQKNIFKKFYQVDTSHTRKHGGSGLGLVICKGIVRGLGGKIWCESEPGKGTKFSFDIPVGGN